MNKMLVQISAVTGLVMLGLLIAASGGWGALALNYNGPHNNAVRIALATAFAVASLVAVIALIFRRWRWRAFTGYLVLFAVWMLWYNGIKPSNDLDWQTDVSKLAYATIDGNFVTVHNIRNFDYRTETDYTPAWYDKRYDLNQLEGVDVISVYWMGPDIAHVFLSFAFAGGDHLAISIETRKTKGQDYSTIEGFFRQYELIYIVADERDVIRLRTNYRHDPDEEVYIYRAKGDIENGQRLFMEYMIKLNELTKRPEFYNTLTTNCTTNIWMNTFVNANHLPFSWKILASGHVPEYLYEHDRLVTGGLTFPELQQKVHVNDRAHAAGNSADFSRLIRE
jgi:uncharacterized membrane protein YhaH (DUF805 family)